LLKLFYQFFTEKQPAKTCVVRNTVVPSLASSLTVSSGPRCVPRGQARVGWLADGARAQEAIGCSLPSASQPVPSVWLSFESSLKLELDALSSHEQSGICQTRHIPRKYFGLQFLYALALSQSDFYGVEVNLTPSQPMA
jgi:hypothetical protein